MNPLDNLRAVAQDPASTIGQIVDALAACASLPDFPTDRFRLALQPSGWASVQITREQAVRACNSYANDHAYGVALRAQQDRERNRDAALRAFWTERGVEARDLAAAVSLIQTVGGFGDNRTTAASGGLDCQLTVGDWSRHRPATLDEVAHNTKPYGIGGVATVGNLRRLAALSIVEHRDQRLYFVADIVEALRDAGFIDADGKAVKP